MKRFVGGMADRVHEVSRQRADREIPRQRADSERKVSQQRADKEILRQRADSEREVPRQRAEGENTWPMDEFELLGL